MRYPGKYVLCAFVAMALAGCGVLDYSPLRDNPNDPGATVVAPPAFDPPAGTYPSAQSVTISCPTSGATIRYTTDGSTPTSSSGALYVSPVTVAGTSTVMAIGYKSGLADSTVSQASYTIPTAKSFASFGFVAPAVTGTIEDSNHTVAVMVPAGTGVTSLVATFTATGSEVRVGTTTQVSGVTANNFTSPVTYTVAAGDGSTQDYLVTVTVSTSTAKSLTSFGFADPAVAGTITESTHTIVVAVPFGAGLTSLVARFVTTGSLVLVGQMTQVSGVTANNFTSPVTYTVVAGDGSTQDYLVTVTANASSAKSLTSFGFVAPAVIGTIAESSHTVALTVPTGTVVTGLVAAFATTGNQVRVGTTSQVSGVTANSFTSPVTYTVVAGDGTTQDYAVSVTAVSYEIGTWSSGPAFATARYMHQSVAYGGYLYVLGGCLRPGAANDVQFASLGAGGAVGNWSSTTPFPSPRMMPG